MNLVRACWELVMMRRNVWRSPEQLAGLQAARLRRLVQHAGTHVPYYRELFRATGVRPEDIRQPADLALLPMTTRTTLQDLPLHDRIARRTNVQHCTSYYTSGSTGRPLQVVLDEADVRRQIQGLIRAYLEIGYRPTQRYCCIAATPDADRRRYLVQRLGLFQVRYVPAIAGIDEHIRALRAFRPHLLMSYPSILRALAERVRSGGIDDIRPAVIASGAEVLDPQTRALVETVFCAPVRNLYGAIEIGNIAFECERGRLHVNVDTLIPEYLVDGRPAMPGEPAELVVTSLDLFTTPLIRYHLGDIVRPTPALCPCGRGLPVITLIEGRCDERVRLPDGATIPGLHLTLGLRLLTPIREFRITQASTGALQVELVGRGPLDAETLAQAAITIRRVVHDQLDVHIYEVPALERGRSFKLRSVVSYVP